MKRDNIFSARKNLVSQRFPNYKISSLIFFDMSNIRYLSGFTGSDGILMLGQGKTFLLVDGRYTTQAKKEVLDAEIIEYKDKVKGISQTADDHDLATIGFEAGSITLEMYNQLIKGLRGKKLMPLGDELRLIRAWKDETEILLMKKAAAISSAAINALIPEIKNGCSEKDLALKLEVIARKSGADQLAFEPIVAFGEHSALPHARPTDKKIKKGDFIVIDFGVKYKGYCSDETCTFAFQKLTDEKRNIYQLVKKAYDAAVTAVKAGAKAAEIDGNVRKIFGDKYKEFFTHGTGHGVGLDVHEAPRLNAASKDVLEAQMVVTAEPGIYFPGRWGIRIEDTLLVKKNSCEKLTKMDKGLIIIE